MLSLVLSAMIAGSMFFNAGAIDSNNLAETEKKMYSTAALEDDFSLDEIIVVLNRNNSAVNRSHSIASFDEIAIESITDLTAMNTQKINISSYEKRLIFTRY